MPQLSETQSRLLSAAADAEDGSIAIPVEVKNSAAGLIKRGLALSIPVADGPSRLLITAAGRSLIDPSPPLKGGDEPLPVAPTDQAPIVPEQETATAAKAPGGKLGLIIGLLRRPEGASIEDMVTATGWQAHSARGALAGSIKKKHGLTVTSAKVDHRRVYRLEAADDAA